MLRMTPADISRLRDRCSVVESRNLDLQNQMKGERDSHGSAIAALEAKNRELQATLQRERGEQDRVRCE